MSFADGLERQALPIRQAILAHPFITGVGDGSLPVDRFKHYVRQDYVYLIDYCRVLALAAARAPDLPAMGWFAKLLDETLHTEMELHRGYCSKFGITLPELEATTAAPATLAYTSFLLKVAYQGSFGELVAAVLPCQWGYWEIGAHLARRGEPREMPLYGEWIRMYASPEFAALAREIRELADGLGERAGPDQREAMTAAYLASFRLEYQFWEMSYNLESWPL